MDHYAHLFKRYPVLEVLKTELEKAFGILVGSFEQGGKLLTCGNGGSASDSDHIVGELMKGFYSLRPLKEDEMKKMGNLGSRLQGALPAIALTMHPALSTAYLNDVDPEMIFAQQVYGYGKKEDVLIALSTSGNSANVVNAVKVAKAKEMKTIAFSGRDGGILKELCDVNLIVPAGETADIQELHLPLYHTLCAMLEEHFFRG